MFYPCKSNSRPQGGNFIYTKQELEEMMKEIKFSQQFPLKELVLGVSKPNGRLNIEDIRLLCKKAYPQKITIHKAIDLSPQPLEDLKDLLEIENITSVLMPTAMEDHEVLNKLSKLSEGKIAIIAAGKITNNNIKQVASLIHTTVFHERKIVGQL
ncbi:copper homeostasis protein CutC [Flammeovirgaceae bacterium SG7u.111]|nr:copper homeostasis protein CutC [Flammeovirgaceae bacterium SG7u.132]WPO33412.1 copper homeostasis protein CutC [Flammeovirgaceae bacterium SG7u.111]